MFDEKDFIKVSTSQLDVHAHHANRYGLCALQAMSILGFAYQMGEGSRRRLVPTGMARELYGERPFCYHLVSSSVCFQCEVC